MAPKSCVNVSLDAELVAETERQGHDVQNFLEAALREQIELERRVAAWRDENRAAIEASNRELEANGHWFEPEWLQS